MQYSCRAARPHTNGGASVIREAAAGLPVRSRSASGVALLPEGLADIAALLFPGLAMNAISDHGLCDGGWDLRDYQRLAGRQCLPRLRRPPGT